MDDVGQIEDGDFENVTRDESSESLSDKLERSVDNLTRKIHESVRNIPQVLANEETNRETEKKSEEICSKFEELVEPLLQWKKEKNETISNLKSSYDEIYAKWKNLETQNKNDQAEIERFKRQISVQSNYCANLGAVLGSLVWWASNQPEMISFWLSERSNEKVLGDFLTIADTTIAVFFKAYGDSLPPKDRNEYKFVRALLGTLTNVAASAEGRQFLIENAAGKCLVKNLVTYLPQVPTASGLSIKKLILLVLWNMCVNINCLQHLFELPIGCVVVHCLNETNAKEIQQLGLNILQSMIYDLEPQLLGQLIESVQIEKIQEIAYTGQDKIAFHAREILDYLSSHGYRISGPNHYFNNNK